MVLCHHIAIKRVYQKAEVHFAEAIIGEQYCAEVLFTVAYPHRSSIIGNLLFFITYGKVVVIFILITVVHLRLRALVGNVFLGMQT